MFLEPVATGTGESSGQCWLNGVERNNFQRPFIYVAVSKADRFPSPPQRTAWKEGYLPEPYFASREEMAVYILAHELRHVWQWRVHNLISQHDAERDACAYGIHMMETRRAAYLPAENLRRRQLSVGQKAMIGGKLRTCHNKRGGARANFGAFGQIRYGVKRMA